MLWIMRFGPSALAMFLALSASSADLRAAIIANDDFSITNGNPNGVWSYGFRGTALGTDFTALSTTSSVGPVNVWSREFEVPLIYHNSDQINPYVDGIVNLQPNEIVLHPNSDGSTEYAVIRFTSSFSGLIDIEAMLRGVDDDAPATTDVHIVKNGVALTFGNLNSIGPGPTLNATTAVQLGDVIDLVVGNGGNDLGNDSTGLFYSISAVPEPSSFALVAGLVGGAWWKRRRKSAA